MNELRQFSEWESSPVQLAEATRPVTVTSLGDNFPWLDITTEV